MGAPKLVSLASVAKRCNSNAGILTKQAKAGVWGELQLIERRGKKTHKALYLPYGQAQVLIEFHKNYAPLETVAKKLGQDKKAVKRVLEGVNKLPENHAAFAHIGGKIGVKKVGNYHYIQLEHAYRLKNALTKFISLEQAAREIGLGKGTLPNLLKKGFWPETGLMNFGGRSSSVHRSVVKKARAFARSHYSLSQAAAKAKMTPSGFHRWIEKWNYPSVRLPAKLNDSNIFVPKTGFKELVSAFKQGKQAAAPVAERHQPPKQYGAREVLDKFDLKEHEIADAAARILNNCATRIQQLAIEGNLEKLSAARELNTASNIKSMYFRLLLEGGGAASPVGRGLSALVQTHLDPGKPTYWTGSLSEDEELEHERNFKKRDKFQLEEEADMGAHSDEMLPRMQKAQKALSELLLAVPMNRFEMLKKMLLPSGNETKKSSKPAKTSAKPAKAKKK